MTDTTDERLKKDLSVDLVGQRGDRKTSDRRAQDRPVTENRELTDADRLEMLRMDMFNDALPDLPTISGYHVCWLTTTNPRDPIHRRLRLGYELIRADEIPGMEYSSLKTGEYEGMVGVNEMVAAKIRTSLYDQYMQEWHHRQPLQDEEKIRSMQDAMREQVEAAGGSLIEDEGFKDMRNPHTPQYGTFEA